MLNVVILGEYDSSSIVGPHASVLGVRNDVSLSRMANLPFPVNRFDKHKPTASCEQAQWERDRGAT